MLDIIFVSCRLLMLLCQQLFRVVKCSVGQPVAFGSGVWQCFSAQLTEVMLIME